jgi:hypothetical protein
MNFQAEHLLARLRPAGIRLFWPFFALFFAALLLGFYNGRLVEQWQNILVWSISGAFAVFGWLVPLISHLTHFTDVSTSRISSRSGFLGQRYREVSLARVSGAQVGAKRTVVLTIQGEEPMVLERVSKPKSVAAEINALIGSK